MKRFDLLGRLARSRSPFLLLAGIWLSCVHETALPETTAASLQRDKGCLKLISRDPQFQLPAKVKLAFHVETCAGEPVSGLRAEDFFLAEDGSPISRYESQQCVLKDPQTLRSNVLILLDISGSIVKSGSLEILKASVRSAVEGLLKKPEDRQIHSIAIYAFDGRAELVPVTDGFLNNPDLIYANIADISCENKKYCQDDSTNLNGAVVAAIDTIAAIEGSELNAQYKVSSLVIFTDGTDQAARVAAHVATQKVKDSKSQVFTIGLGGEVDKVKLQQLASTPNNFFPASQTTELQAAFAKVEEGIRRITESYYTLEYCSPKRNGKHRLSLIAIDKKNGCDTWSAPFDGSGFSGGCETPCSGKAEPVKDQPAAAPAVPLTVFPDPRRQWISNLRIIGGTMMVAGALTGLGAGLNAANLGQKPSQTSAVDFYSDPIGFGIAGGVIFVSGLAVMLSSIRVPKAAPPPPPPPIIRQFEGCPTELPKPAAVAAGQRAGAELPAR